MSALHQFVPTFEHGAVGGHMLELQRLLREVGEADSQIFAEHVAPSMAGLARPYRDYARSVPGRRADVLLYQMAIGSVVADFLESRRERLVVNHHSLTPAEFFQSWEPIATHGVRWGRAQLDALADRVELGIAVSAFDRVELVEAGYRRTVVAPVMVDLEAFDRELDAGALATLQRAKEGGGVDWLFVGRVVPNKCQHDVVKAFATYRKLYDPKARLHLVGASSSHSYWTALGRYVAALGLSDAVEITGGVSAGVLAAQFRAADVFVCLSEHEGFCVPLLEAMHHQLPIVAFDAAAVPETLANAGVLLVDKSPPTVAAAVNRVLVDEPLRDALAAAAALRLADFTLERSRARWVDVLESVGVPAR